MGCDIHGYVQAKKWMGPYWYDALNISSVVGRNYEMFRMLFGVRGGDDNSLAVDRGLPEDAGEFIENEANCIDWHSHSWLGYSELKEVYDELSWEWKALVDIMKILDSMVDCTPKNKESVGGHTCRVIVWFDN